MINISNWGVRSLGWWPWAQSWIAWAADGFLTYLEGRKKVVEDGEVLDLN
jgi:hypothetical protein